MATVDSIKKNLSVKEDKPALVQKKNTGRNYTYVCDSGLQISLSIEDVKKYLVSGNVEAVTNQELMIYLQRCMYLKLNPWLGECLLIKYSDKKPASIIVTKEAFKKRADRNEAYKGDVAGIIVVDKEGNKSEVIGTVYDPERERLLGGWARVEREGRTATEIKVMFNEYAMKTFNRESQQWELAANWRDKPATMIRKVALVQALREAFPEELGGAYVAEEMGEYDAQSILDEGITENKAIEDGSGETDNYSLIEECEEIQETTTPVNEEIACSICNKKGLTKEVIEFSIEKYGEAICYSCQKKKK